MKSTSGKLIALAMIALALAAAAASFWYHRATGARALEFWGSENARRIARASQVEVLEILGRDTPGSQPAPSGNQGTASSARSWDASQARGIGNIRRTLIEDASYDWKRPRPQAAGRWKYRLRFSDERGHADVWLSEDGTAGSSEGGPFAQLTPEAFESFKGFFDDLQSQPAPQR